jgi:hypothetical protein
VALFFTPFLHNSNEELVSPYHIFVPFVLLYLLYFAVIELRGRRLNGGGVLSWGGFDQTFEKMKEVGIT